MVSRQSTNRMARTAEEDVWSDQRVLFRMHPATFCTAFSIPRHIPGWCVERQDEIFITKLNGYNLNDEKLNVEAAAVKVVRQHYFNKTDSG